MDPETAHRHSQNAALSYPHHYYVNERNIPLTVATSPRYDPRGYSVGGPVGGHRLRAGMDRDDVTMDSNQARRRIAVACARCRKRKIRCSGDPGNGTGCASCKQAGLDSSVCQFHRVGSGEATRVLDNLHLASNLTNMANTNVMMPIYNAASPAYSRATYPPSWPIPYTEETSPVETYSLSEPAAYLPSHNGIASSNAWSHPPTKPLQTGAHAFLDTDSMPVYETHGSPYVQTGLRAVTNSEALSPLNMTSLQLTLPEPPQARPSQASETTVPQRQLPMPQPSPAQTSRNVVDQLQHQRLRSAQAMGGSALSTTGAYPKSTLPFNDETGLQVTAPAEASSSADLTTQVTAPATIPGTTETMIGYLPGTTSASDDAAVTSAGSQHSLNFSTSGLLDTTPAPALPTTYSNFRNYNLPTSSSTETLSPLARQDSQSNLYSFTPDSNSKRHSAGRSSNDSALVSGHRYTPLNQSQHQPNHDGLRRDSFEARKLPVRRAFMSNL